MMKLLKSWDKSITFAGKTENSDEVIIKYELYKLKEYVYSVQFRVGDNVNDGQFLAKNDAEAIERVERKVDKLFQTVKIDILCFIRTLCDTIDFDRFKEEE